MTRLEVGDPAPLFVGRTAGGEEWWLSTAAGARVVLAFADGAITVGWPDPQCSIVDDGSIAGGYGLRDARATVVLDERLRVLAVLDDDSRVAEVLAAPAEDIPPPVLVVPRVFEPDFCARLVAEYDRIGGTDSGFVRTDEHGRTVGVIDHAHKRRGDLIIDDPELRAGMRDRLQRRLLLEIRRAFQFTATRVERYLVACYGVDDHFRPHRDNTTKGTAHRRFAVTINLNDGYTGGDLRFPEFGQRTHRAPLGGAIVFSCSLLHEATPVTEGRRYCTVPFLYDEAAEAVRQQNLAHVTHREPA